MVSRTYPYRISIDKLDFCDDKQGMNCVMIEENGGEKVLNNGYCPEKADIVRHFRTTALFSLNS